MTPNQPLPFGQRIMAAGSMLLTGKQPNPLAKEPDNKSRGKLVKELNQWCLDTRAFWKPVFDRIRQEQKFAAGFQWERQKLVTEGEEDYIGDIVQQMVNRKTASLYAKNPTPEAALRDRMQYTVWDENHETIQACRQLIAQVAPQAMQAHEAELAGQSVTPPPAGMMEDLQKAQAILADYERGLQEKNRLLKVARTGEKLIQQQWESQSPDLLVMAKNAVTQIITSRVAYVKVMFKRDMEVVPTETANEMEIDEKIANLKQRLQALDEANMPEDDPRREEARLMRANIEREMQELQAGAEQPGTEELIFDWLSATSVLVDRKCRNLKEFVAADRIAHEMMMTIEEVEAKYGVKLHQAGAKVYTLAADGWTTQDRQDYQNDDRQSKDRRGKEKVCVWEIQDKNTGNCYVICDGVKDFLKEPEENYPDVNRFWTIAAVTFNYQTVEENFPDDDCTIYPRSDVRLLMPMQQNINTAGQERRKHRAANRPAWVGVKSKFASTKGQNDLDKLSKPRNAHDVFMMEGLQPGEKILDYIQPLPKQEFDPNLYDTAADMQAMMYATGQQPSDIGAQRPDEKATGQNIAAQARAATEGSNIEDLNFWFSTIAQMCWEILITEMAGETVKKLVGPGAVWPDVNKEEVAKSIYFKIEAGSMGRPNQQADMQKFQILGPQLLEMFKLVGKSPEPLLRLALRIYDSNIDVDQLLQEASVPLPPAPEAQKAPSVSISTALKDLPPTVQTQAVQKYYGLQPASPQETLLNKVGMDKAVQAHTANNTPQPEPKPGKVAA